MAASMTSEVSVWLSARPETSNDGWPRATQTHRYNERDPEVISEIAIQYFLDGRTKEAWQLIDKLGRVPEG